MPDDILISELSLAPAIDDGAVFPFSQDNGGTDATFKAPMSQMAGKIAETTTYANLQTTSKTLVGAINEAAQSGGSTEIEGSASGSIATFNDGGNNIPCKSVTAQIVATQAGSGTPSPSNVRAISGFGSVGVNVCGINQWDEQWELGTLGWADGSEQPANDYIRAKNYIPVKPSTTYYIVVGSKGLTVYTYGIDKSFKRRVINGSTSVLLQINADEYFIRFRTASQTTTYDNDISINYPSTDTSYHSYNGTTHTITLPETIYGGELECVGGSGKKSFERVDLSTLNWTYISDNLFYADDDLGEYRGVGKLGLCEIYEVVDNVSGAVQVPATNNIICGYTSTGNHRIYCRNTSYTDATQLKNSMIGKYLVYKLATPTTFTTTPESIPTLSGVNNIYADSGDVDLEYFNENADEIFELISVYPYEVSGVLTAGQTSITLSSSLIKSTSTIDVYTSDGTNYNSVSVSDGSVIITFDAQVSNLGVKVRVS